MKIMIALTFSFFPLIGSSNKDLDTRGRKIFDTVVRIAQRSRQGRFEDPKPQLKSLAKTDSADDYEIIMKEGIPSYLVTSRGYTPLIGTVWGNLSDVEERVMKALNLCEIKKPSSLTLWVGGTRYSVGRNAPALARL